jgi:phage baseplate assembly protein W
MAAGEDSATEDEGPASANSSRADAAVDREAQMEWDVFISHASEDKEDFVRPLAERLRQRDLRVWYDDFTLTVGDSLRRSIDRGLARSRYGIVVISLDFLRKEWPQRELDGLVAREIGGVKIILPIWHGIDANQIREYSPSLADRVAALSAKGLDHVTDELLRAIDRRPEAQTQGKVVPQSTQSNLIAIGPEIVCTGDLRAIEASEWTVHIEDFVIGDFNRLVSFIDRFAALPPGYRYVLVNALGDGRVLSEAPDLDKLAAGYRVRCPVAASFPRIEAQQLGSQWAISPATDDLFVKNGQIARVSGLDALPQVVRSCLSLQRGEMMFQRDYGVRIADYFDAFRGSPWLAQLLKLEVIRQAAIPYHDEVQGRQYTPLYCVERVKSIEVLGDNATNKWVPVRVDFDVRGIGRWQCDLSICVPSPAALAHIRERQKGFIALR